MGTARVPAALGPLPRLSPIPLMQQLPCCPLPCLSFKASLQNILATHQQQQRKKGGHLLGQLGPNVQEGEQRLRSGLQAQRDRASAPYPTPPFDDLAAVHLPSRLPFLPPHVHTMPRGTHSFSQARERNFLAPLRLEKQGNVGRLAVTQAPRSALFGPLQPGPVLGLLGLRAAAAQGHLGESRRLAVVLLGDRDTDTHSLARQ